MRIRKPFWPKCSIYIHSPYRLSFFSTLSKPVMAGAQRNASSFKPPHKPRNERPEKRPPLTHFLCLPLVNEISIQQLETSIDAFKAAYPPVPVADLPASRDISNEITDPLIPDGAIRPLGTLHLTLGVMSLPTKDRLNEALRFFQSLDLRALMSEAERVASDLRTKQASSNRHPGAETSSTLGHSSSSSSHTFMISLESLHAFPRPKTATVLHASPTDSTGRLYPFCIMLRDKFIEAGFISGEGENQSNTKGASRESIQGESAKPNPSISKDIQSASNCPDLAVENEVSQGQVEYLGGNRIVTREPKLDPYKAALARKPKPRPLLLHATLVNTIYVRGRPKANGPKPKGGPKRIEFDARNLLAKYRDYYADEARTIPRGLSAPVQHEGDTGGSVGRTPFVWASKIPIDSVCICEMGARKPNLDDAAMADPASALWSARLGEKYTVVTERSIDSPGTSTSRPISQENVDGGVKLR